MENIKSTAAIFPSQSALSQNMYMCHTRLKKLKGKGQTGGQIRNDTFGTGYIEEPWPI
jgi:hypothetical protein